MPRRFAIVPGFDVLMTAFRRVGAWLGVLALVGQLLAPLSAAQAMPWVEQGLFPPTCSVHGADQNSADQTQCQQCPLCQMQAGLRVPVPVLAAAAPVSVPVGLVRFPILGRDVPAAPASQPPLPSRGPPAAA